MVPKVELLGVKNFAVLLFTPDSVRGARFDRADKSWKLTRFAAVPLDKENPAASWKSVLKEIEHRDGLLLLTGALPGGVFFQFKSADLPNREQRGAVDLELPRHLMNIPEKRMLQFAASAVGDDLQVNVGVYVFEESSLNGISAKMTQSACRADGFIYPFLAVEPGDPELYLPEIEAGFSFAKGAWNPVNNPDAAVEATLKNWQEILRKQLSFPEDKSNGFDLAEMFPILVVARLFASGKFERNRSALAVLPEKLRPVRFRGHLIVTTLLLILIAANILWHYGRIWTADYTRYSALQKENKKLKRDIDLARRNSKRLQKEQKEMERVIESGAGDPDVIQKFALLSNALPGNVLVSSIRWSDSSVDMILQCEDAKLDLPSIINPLGYWKIGQLQQRQTGDSAVATITLKLIPNVKKAVPVKGSKRGKK